MPLLTYNGFGALDTQRPNFDAYIYIHYAVPHHLLPPGWQRLIEFGLPCATRGNEADRRIYEGWVRTSVLF